MADPLEAQFDAAAQRLAAGTLSAEDLAQLRDASLARSRVEMRQRLLYMQSTSPFIGAGLISAVIHEPVAGGCGQLDPTGEELPYQCVHDAIVDGWQVVQFPDQRVIGLEPATREVGVLGYQFILQKFEPAVVPDATSSETS